VSDRLGIDIGGSGIKAGLVDLTTGALRTQRVRVPTPQPATPRAITEVVAALVSPLEIDGTVGATFPAVIKQGVAKTAANVDKSWLGLDVAAALSGAIGASVKVVNDADAAGLAEMRVGAGRDAPGTVVTVTFGTGIGTALFIDGTLVPNTELGHLELDGSDAEARAAESARDREGLSWAKWAKRVQRYLRELEMLLTPDLFIVGGGASKKAESWVPAVEVQTPILVAALRNDAGIVGAAFAAAETPPVPAVPASAPTSP
jgi:polyphosphate glucokinase